MDIIISHAITALLGGLIAAAVTYLIVTRSSSGRSAASTRAELKQYRERVADHFARTAALVDQLTDSYKDVFDQLQAGATELLDAETLREKLAHQGSEVITLNRLGYRGTEDSDGGEANVNVVDEKGEEDVEPSERQPADAVAEESEEPGDSVESPESAESAETAETVESEGSVKR